MYPYSEILSESLRFQIVGLMSEIPFEKPAQINRMRVVLGSIGSGFWRSPRPMINSLRSPISIWMRIIDNLDKAEVQTKQTLGVFSSSGRVTQHVLEFSSFTDFQLDILPK